MKRKSFLAGELRDDDALVYMSPGHAPSVVTTLGPNGIINVATFEQTMVVSYQPPRLLLAITPSCDTYQNIKDVGECVVGFMRKEVMQAAYDAGVKLPRDVSELAYIAGFTVEPSKFVAPPSLEQCWVNFECKLYKIASAGDHDMVLLDIVHAAIEEDIWKPNRVAMRNGLPAVYYTTSGWFFEPGDFRHVQLSNELRNLQNGD